MNLSVDQALKKAELHLRNNAICEAKELFEAVLQAFPGNKRAQQGLKSLRQKNTVTGVDDVMQEKINELISLYNTGYFSKVVEESTIFTQQYPDSFVIWNVMGAAAAQVDMLDLSIIALRKVIFLKPDHAIAHNNLGNALVKLDNYPEAIEAFKNAIAIQSDNVDAHYNMSIALRLQGAFEEAMEACDRVLKLEPRNAPAHHNMGRILQNLGRPEEAIKAYQTAIQIKPDYAEAINFLGKILLSQKKLSEALCAYEKLAAFSPDDPNPYIGISECFMLQGNYEEAKSACSRALQIDPESADAFNATGNIWKKLYKLKNAQAAFEKAIEIQPDFVGAHVNLSDCFRLQGKFADALLICEKALDIAPNLPNTYNCMGTILQEMGETKEAIKAYQTAIQIKPDYAEAINCLGRCYWLKKDFVNAFKYQEWRWQANQSNIGEQFVSNKPDWNGEKSENVFVWKEQGIGDELMFSSVLMDLVKKSKNVVVECDSRLLPLYRRSFPKNTQFIHDRVHISDEEYDSQIAIGSLPKYLRQDVNDFKSSAAGWLRADVDKIKMLREKLRADTTDKIIGISWRTMAAVQKSKHRNIALSDLIECLGQTPAKLVSLQYGDVTEEVTRLSCDTGINVLQMEEIDNFRDIDDLAALICACDLVISIDNFTVHLAGSLGIDTRVLLPRVADERWGLNTNDSYWYDSLTLYRQEVQGDWSHPLQHMLNDLME